VGNLHIHLRGMFGRSWLGGTIYIQNLLHAIACVPVQERSHIRLSVTLRPSITDTAGSLPSCVDHVYIDRFFKAAYLNLCKSLAEHVSFIPLGLLNPRRMDFVYPETAGKRAPYAWGGWIPDFQYRYYPNFFSEKEIADLKTRHGKIAQVAPIIVLSSQTAKEDFQRFYPEAAARSTVMSFVSYIEEGWWQLNPRAIQEKYGLPDRFFMVSNQFWKHKGHSTVVEALDLLRRSGVRPTVVCTGSYPDRTHSQHDYYRQLLKRVEEMNLARQFRMLGFISRAEQIGLMRRCLAIIQPSFFEGWSTVVEDAHALGKPMLISDFPVHIEQNPPDSKFFERGNHEQLALLMAEYFSVLKPGPTPEKEHAVRQENRERLMRVGRRFLDIVHSVV
jgi:glycosyltransferase involved in cell wall biosynthesis